MDTAQAGPDLAGAGDGRIVLRMWSGITQLDVPLNSLINRRRLESYSFLKINRVHTPHWEAALGSPEVYNPPALRCFGFSGEDMVLREQSVYGRRMAFTWQGREPVAELTCFHTICFARWCHSSQTLEENLYWFPFISDFCNALQ